jgi:glucose-6-phosphate isomerase
MMEHFQWAAALVAISLVMFVMVMAALIERVNDAKEAAQQAANAKLLNEFEVLLATATGTTDNKGGE